MDDAVISRFRYTNIKPASIKQVLDKSQHLIVSLCETEHEPVLMAVSCCLGKTTLTVEGRGQVAATPRGVLVPDV